jgi:hypothetical protein
MPSRIELDGLGGLLLNGDMKLRRFFAIDFPAEIAAILHGFDTIIGGMQYLPPLREIPKREMDLRSCRLPGWRWIHKNPRLVNSVNSRLASMGIKHSMEVRELVPTTFVEAAIFDSVTRPEDYREKATDLISAAQTARDEWNALSNEELGGWLQRHPALHARFIEKWYWEVSRNKEFWGSYYDEYPECEEGTKPPEWWLCEEADRQSDNDEWIHSGTEENDWASTLFMSEHPAVRGALDAVFGDQEFKRKIETSVERIELRLRHEQANAWVALQDVGVGTSQSLPVILEAYGQTNQLIAIEQPELHLHPALQAELGDVFIESALGENKNTSLLETHSEHLILRILRRIRETTEGDTGGWPESLLNACPNGIRQEDVAVLYVQPGENGSEVIELPVDANGEFTCEWPGGFFEERLREFF